MCRVSIIVPLYNGEKTIKRCLDSLVQQTLEELEILVVDDGSVDDGAEIVRKYAEQDPRVRYFFQENQGQGAARNHGIAAARGTYIGFVDCDDFVDPAMYEIMVNTLEQTGAHVAVCQEKNVYLENGKIHLMNETKFPSKEPEVYFAGEVLLWMLNYTYMSLNSMCYKVIERRIFMEHPVKFPEGHRYAEDLVASAGVLSCAETVAVIPRSLYYYVHDLSSFTYTYSIKHAEDVYLDWKDVMNYLRRSGSKAEIANFSLGMCFGSLKQIYWADENKNSEQAKKLKRRWREARRHYKWKPRFRSVKIPFPHKVKVCVAYFNLCRPFFGIVSLLRWIPLFKYMA